MLSVRGLESRLLKHQFFVAALKYKQAKERLLQCLFYAQWSFIQCFAYILVFEDYLQIRVN